MNVFLDLFLSFFKIGLFAVGGGPATIPYLMELTRRPNAWFDMRALTNMVAIAESTPGPIGLNMATYAGYKAVWQSGLQALSVFGGIVSTLGLVFPSVVIIILIAKFLNNFSQNAYVQAAFRGIRPAVTAVIAAAVVSLTQVSLFSETMQPQWGSIAVAVVVFVLLQIKKINKFHPALWFAVGAAAGLIFRL